MNSSWLTYGIRLGFWVSLFLNLSPVSTRHHPKCIGTINSDAYENTWQEPTVKWKSRKHEVEGVVDATIHGRVGIPTGVGQAVTLSHECYAQLQVNLTDCSIVMASNGMNASGWAPHKSPIYVSQETWPWNETIDFRPDCPEKIHVEVFPNL